MKTKEKFNEGNFLKFVDLDLMTPHHHPHSLYPYSTYSTQMREY